MKTNKITYKSDFQVSWQVIAGGRFFAALITFLLAATSFTEAQTISRVGTTAAPFLKIGVGGRALAMGEAVTTISNDITGLYWNPAGIAQITTQQAGISHYSYIADLTYDFGAVAVPVPEVGTFGLFFSYLNSPDIERTTIYSPNGTGEKVSSGFWAVGLGYGRELTDRFSIGANIKFIRESIWHSQADGYAFDIGINYITSFKNIKLGMMISNFGPGMQMGGRDIQIQHDIAEGFDGNNENINGHLDTDEFPLPMQFKMGLSADLTKDFMDMPDYSWIVAVDAVHPNDNDEYLNLGTEFGLYERFFLRTGYRKLFLKDSLGGLSFGGGAKVDVLGFNLAIDYANVDFGRLDHQNKFSLTLSF